MIHHDITFYSNIRQCKHLLLNIFDFLKEAFCIFMQLIRNDHEDSEQQLMLIDLRLISRVFDDIALNFFSHFFYELSGKVILFEVDFKILLGLLFWHHHINIEHNSNMLYKYDNLYPMFFLIIHHRYLQPFCINPYGNNSKQAINYFLLEY